MNPTEGNTNQPPANTSSWGDWFKNGTTYVVSGVAGWQTSAIVQAWAPKLLMDYAIAKEGLFWGGLVVGPNLVKTTAPLVTWVSGGVGFLTSGATGLLMIGGGMVINKVIDIAGDVIETRKLKAEQREAQLQQPEQDLNIIVVDDFEDLFNEKLKATRDLTIDEIRKLATISSAL